ncbi:MAG: hypothetical protein WAN44_20420, partial [Propionibacteriaceae bacterium]
MAGQPLSARRRVVTLVAMCVAQGMILLDNTIVNVALPSIQRELDVDPGNLIWVVNAYVLAHHGRRDIGGPVRRQARVPRRAGDLHRDVRRLRPLAERVGAH